MSQLVVSMILLVVSMRMWETYRDRHSCAYCGRFKTHESSCPYERFENH